MAEIVVGAVVVNKRKQTGKVLAFDGKYITAQFEGRTAAFQPDAFRKGFLTYADPDLQALVTQVQSQAAREAEAIRSAAEKANRDRQTIQAQISAAHFNVAVAAASIRLDSAPANLRSVRVGDTERISQIFTLCDRETQALYASVPPRMEYLREYYAARSKFCVGFLCRYLDTYVFRVFSRNDDYRLSPDRGLTVTRSDTTEVLRALEVNGRVYCFSKNLTSGGSSLVNTNANPNWHVSDLSGSLLLNRVVRTCPCGYLDDYIEAENVDCLQYLNLLLPAFSNNKAEIVFKHRQFSAAHRIGDIVGYLEPFTPKQIVFACEHDVLNTLPMIRRYGVTEPQLLRDLESLMRKRRSGSSIYDSLLGSIHRLEPDFPEPGKSLIAFLKKVRPFDPATYYDYITEVSQRPGVTVKDLFDKNYIQRHDILMMEKLVQCTPQEQEAYARIAKELSWIEREEDGYFVVLPKTIGEFRTEGERQHNCVFTNRYYRLVIRKESIIVFLRRERHTPFVTVEFDYETFQVLQAYGKFNSRIEPQVYTYIVNLGKRLHYEMHSQA